MSADQLADSSGPDDWAPEFDGQRPPFQPGNDAAVKHGARSERHIRPLAAQIARDLLEDPDTPPHIREPLFRASVEAWANAEAICRLLRDWLAERDIMAGLTSVATTTEEETQGNGRIDRRSVTRSIPSVLEFLRKWESIASNARSRLGLDPASAARVGRDLSQSRYYASATPLDTALAEAEQQRALTAGGDDG